MQLCNELTFETLLKSERMKIDKLPMFINIDKYYKYYFYIYCFANIL